MATFVSTWLLGGWRTAVYVAASAALVYLSTVLAIRGIGERRTLTQMTIFDFSVAVALGAVIARTATTASPSYVQGIVAVIALLVTHNAIGAARRRFPRARRLFDRAALVLVVDGQIQDGALRRAHLTVEDLRTVLRERGVPSLRDARLVLLESRGAFSVLRSDRVDDRLWPDHCGDTERTCE